MSSVSIKIMNRLNAMTLMTNVSIVLGKVTESSGQASARVQKTSMYLSQWFGFSHYFWSYFSFKPGKR